MARVTRSAAQHTEKDKQPDPSTSARAKSSTKKRKRTSLADGDDQPVSKQPRSENAIKEENQPDDVDKLNKGKLPELELAADVPIDSSDAQKLLDILDIVDSQGLLDRVFPLPSSDLSEPSTSKSESGSFSLRALLREPSQHPLRVIRAAVQNLFPISYHPRSRPSSPAAEQLRFCNLACSLLSQASFHSVPLPLDIETILSDFSEAPAEGKAASTFRSDKTPQWRQINKYALVQRLPSATWWTSLNSDFLPVDTKEFKDLQTANAELVAVLPSPVEPPQGEVGSSGTPSVTLGSYAPKKPPGHKPKLPGSRRVSCGAFLHYGSYASFAPVFDQDGVEIGRSTMGELLWRWEDRKKMWNEERSLVEESLEEVLESPPPNGTDDSEEKVALEDSGSLEGLFSKEQVSLLKQALGSLELEAAVQELLERNARALKRLEELQIKRLSQPGEFTPVEEGSEEWDTAQSILDSLSILTSLRPRQSSTDTAPLTPSASALHRLQQTLPIAPTQGWYGTLPADHPTALRDDSTLYIKSTATTIPTVPPAAPTPTPTPAQPAPTPTTTTSTAAAAQAYAGYAYNYATPYRPPYQYKPGQGAPYYPNAYTAQTSGQAQAASQYYQTQQYSTTGQQQYTYSSWYPYNPQTQSNAAASGSRKGTPQPSTTATAAANATTSSAIPTSYAGFFNANAQTSGQRAVANTVLATTSGGKPYQPAAAGTWTAPSAATAGYTAPTLPPHLRSAVVGQAGTAGSYNGSMYQPNYYGTYQATPSPAQS